MKIKHILSLAAMVAATSAHASLDGFYSGCNVTDCNSPSNSSLAFVAIDSTGTNVGSVFLDLGYHVNDFVPGGTFDGPDQKVVWDFKNNTITVNGSVVNIGTNDWTSSYSTFFGASAANNELSEYQWGVIGGDSTSLPQRIVTTGTPTAAQLTQENGSATSGALGVGGGGTPVGNNPTNENAGWFYNTRLAIGSNPADNAGYATLNATDPAYGGLGTNFGPQGKWQNKLKWSALLSGGSGSSSTNFWLANATGTEQKVGDPSTYAGGASAYDASALLNSIGTFTFDEAAGTLTWQTAVTPVPEASSYAAMLVGVMGLGLLARKSKKA